MKNKTLKFIGVVVITTFILSYLSSTALVSAANGEPNFLLETSDEKNYGMGVIQTERPVASTLQMSGEVSGAFTYTDYLGNPLVVEESVLETENSELYYPVNLRYENYWNVEHLSEFNTHYARARNVSDLPDQHGEYEATFVTEQYTLSVDSSCEISVSDLTSEILLDVSKKGIYQIWMNNINLLFSPVIFSPTDKMVIPVEDELPPVMDGGDSLGKYFFFAAYETGVFRIYLQTNDPIITLKAEYHKAQTIKLGEGIHGGKDPSDPTFFDTVYTMDVYQINIGDLETVYKYLLDFEYGSPALYRFVEDSISSQPMGFNPGTNQILSSVTEGKIYLVVDNPNYFSWADPGIDEADPLKYAMRVDEIDPIEHIIGENETINLAKSIGVTARSFEIEETSVVSFHCEDLGANSPNVYQNKIQKIDGDEIRDASILSSISTTGGLFTSAILEPGKYRIIFQHSNSMGSEYLHFYTNMSKLEPLDVGEMSLPGISPAYNFTSLNFSDIRLPIWEEYPGPYGATYPGAFALTIDENFWDYGYNISLYTDKNDELFDDYITPNLAFLLDDTGNTFINYTAAIQPGNSQLVPAKTSGGDVGDALTIGSYDRFDRIMVNLSNPTDKDAFVWQFYQDGTGWVDIDSEDPNFADGTRTATGSLTQSGTVSWDPDQLTDWDFIQRTSNSTSSSVELPDTGDQPYYLIRVRCNDSTASIANLVSVNLRKFIKIRFDATSRLAFNIGTPEDPVYYQASIGSISNRVFDFETGLTSYRDTSHTIDKNYFSNDAILYLAINDLRQYNYNGSNTGTAREYADVEKPLNFSAGVFQPIDNKRFIEYNITENVPTTHSNQLNFSTLPMLNYTENIDIPDQLKLYLKINPRTMYDWTQINVEFVDADVQSTTLINPAIYDLNTVGYYLGVLGNGKTNLGYSGVNMTETIEFGFITETLYLEFVIENTTNNPAVIHVYGGQFNYPMLTILKALSTTNWGLIGGIGGGVVVLIAVAVVIYKKKNPV